MSIEASNPYNLDPIDLTRHEQLITTHELPVWVHKRTHVTRQSEEKKEDRITIVEFKTGERPAYFDWTTNIPANLASDTHRSHLIFELARLNKILGLGNSEADEIRIGIAIDRIVAKEKGSYLQRIGEIPVMRGNFVGLYIREQPGRQTDLAGHLDRIKDTFAFLNSEDSQVSLSRAEGLLPPNVNR